MVHSASNLHNQHLHLHATTKCFHYYHTASLSIIPCIHRCPLPILHMYAITNVSKFSINVLLQPAAAVYPPPLYAAVLCYLFTLSPLLFCHTLSNVSTYICLLPPIMSLSKPLLVLHSPSVHPLVCSTTNIIFLFSQNICLRFTPLVILHLHCIYNRCNNIHCTGISATHHNHNYAITNMIM